MSKYKVKSLIQAALDGEVDVIGHGCNCFNVMKSGIAPLIAKEFPEAWEADQATVKGDKEKLGGFSYGYHAFYPEGGIHVLNLYSQYAWWGRKEGRMDLDYDALRSSLRMGFGNFKTAATIGLPKIGSKLAGGDWNIIENIIKEELTDKGYDVTIYVLKPNEIPAKDRMYSLQGDT
jgi:O-acetyl-ADP-ribose deacetylase (regulator of RNase III)